MSQGHIRFCRCDDGCRLAYEVSGHGPPVLLLPSWLTHLDYQWRSTAWRPWLQFLSERYRLIRYDPRGCGLSDRDGPGLSFERWVRDVETILDAAEVAAASVIGICQGGAVAVAHAAARPDRVERLVLYGTYARGRDRRGGVPIEAQKARLMLEMLELGWADEDGAFMRAFATQFQPDGGIEHLSSWCALQRNAATARDAVALTRIMFDIDVTEAASRVGVPTLVAHARGDAVVPVAEAHHLARAIPDARLVEFDSRNHFMLPREPAWGAVVDTLAAFLPRQPEDDEFVDLSLRERQVLHAVAEGLDNREIGAALDIAEKTVRNHVSHIFSKLGVASRGKAIVAAIRAGFGSGGGNGGGGSSGGDGEGR